MPSADARQKNSFKLFSKLKNILRKEKSTGGTTPVSQDRTPDHPSAPDQTGSDRDLATFVPQLSAPGANATTSSTATPSHVRSTTILREHEPSASQSNNEGLTPFPSQTLTLPDKGKQSDHRRVPSLSIQKPSDGERQSSAPPVRQDPLSGLSPSTGNRRRGSSAASARSSLRRREPSQIIEEPPLKHIFPHAYDVSCTLIVTYNNEVIQKKEPVKFTPFCWYEPDIYEKVVAEIESQQASKQAEAETGHTLRLYYGSFRIVGQDYEYSEKISALSQLGEITIQNICGVIHKHPKQRFYLEYFIDFSSVRTRKKRDNERYCDLVREQVQTLMDTNTNFHQQPFVPRNHRDQFATKEIISSIISEQSSLDFGENEKLTNKIILSGATGLFLACITSHQTISVFRNLFETCRFKDDALPPSNQKPPHLNDVDKNQYQRLVKHIHAYFAKTIEGHGKHEELEKYEVMPILHVRDDPAKENTELGKGAAGFVYKHNKSQFALKTIRQEDKNLFDRERAMLSRLRANRHPHIVRHIMTWYQHETYYILYPLARGNLRSYMGEFPPPKMTLPTVRWFLRQICGLASAVYYIHDQQEREEKSDGHSSPTPPGSIDSRAWKRLSVDSFKKPPSKRSGYHHDLKPENILIFERRKGINPVFKISDFGAGKFTDLKEEEMSHKASNLGGTQSYFGPEWRQERSRPFDIWAIACVLTELLIWFLRDDKLAEFHDKLDQQSASNPGISTDCYWHVVGGQQRLKDAVSDFLDKMENSCAQQAETTSPSPESMLKDLPQIIRLCFAIDPLSRPSARQLHETLQQMHYRAEIAPEEAEMSIHTPSTPGSRHSQDDGGARVHGEATLPPRESVLTVST